MAFDPTKTNIAVLSGNPEHSSLDRQILTRLKFKRVKIFSSADEAHEYMVDNPVHMALIDSFLKDMDGTRCVKYLKNSRSARLVPLIMVTLENRRDQVLDAISAGCAGYVLRPYSLQTFERHLSTAHESFTLDGQEDAKLAQAKNLVSEGNFDTAIEEFESIVEVKNEAQRYFDMGTDFLMKQQFGKAIIAFNKAVKYNEVFAEAYNGLAQAHKGKGNDEKYKEYIHKAADIFAAQDRFQEAKDLFVEILKTDPDAVNPYNTLGMELRKKNDINGALHAYGQALGLTPTDENLHYNTAKAYAFAKDKDNAMSHLRQALEIRPDFPEAREMLEYMETGKKKKKSGSAKAAGKKKTKPGKAIN